MNYILKDMNNKTILVKTNKSVGDVCDKNNMYKILDNLYEKKVINLDIKEDFEFGKMYIPREDEFNFLQKMGFEVFNINL